MEFVFYIIISFISILGCGIICLVLIYDYWYSDESNQSSSHIAPTSYEPSTKNYSSQPSRPSRPMRQTRSSHFSNSLRYTQRRYESSETPKIDTSSTINTTPSTARSKHTTQTTQTQSSKLTLHDTMDTLFKDIWKTFPRIVIATRTTLNSFSTSSQKSYPLSITFNVLHRTITLPTFPQLEEFIDFIQSIDFVYKVIRYTDTNMNDTIEENETSDDCENGIKWIVWTKVKIQNNERDESIGTILNTVVGSHSCSNEWLRKDIRDVFRKGIFYLYPTVESIEAIQTNVIQTNVIHRDKIFEPYVFTIRFPYQSQSLSLSPSLSQSQSNETRSQSPSNYKIDD